MIFRQQTVRSMQNRSNGSAQLYNEAEDVPHFCKWGCNISEQAVSISPASLKRQLEDFAYGKI